MTSTRYMRSYQMYPNPAADSITELASNYWYPNTNTIRMSQQPQMPQNVAQPVSKSSSAISHVTAYVNSWHKVRRVYQPESHCYECCVYILCYLYPSAPVLGMVRNKLHISSKTFWRQTTRKRYAAISYRLVAMGFVSTCFRKRNVCGSTANIWMEYVLYSPTNAS